MLESHHTVEHCEGPWMSSCRNSVVEKWWLEQGALGLIHSNCQLAFHFSLIANIISVFFFLALVHAADSTADVAMVFKDHGRICD